MTKISLFYKAVCGILIIAVGACFMYTKSSKPKVGYVVVQELFNEFDLKKELEKKLETVKNARQKITDSLRIELTLLSRKLQTAIIKAEEKALFEQKRLDYQRRMEQFAEENNLLTKQFDSEIVIQLNQYVKDFGKQYNYDMIYGNNADGSLMFGKEEYNVTKDVQQYINNKYKGVN